MCDGGDAKCPEVLESCHEWGGEGVSVEEAGEGGVEGLGGGSPWGGLGIFEVSNSSLVEEVGLSEYGTTVAKGAQGGRA